MFPIGLYVKLGIIAIGLLFSAYLGYSFEHSRFMAFKARIVEETRAQEIQAQANADKIRIEKNAQIKAINNQLVDAIGQLRSRSNIPTKTINGQDCNGSTLSAPDATFLIREAARADEIRVGLQACYKQYEAIK